MTTSQITAFQGVSPGKVPTHNSPGSEPSPSSSSSDRSSPAASLDTPRTTPLTTPRITPLSTPHITPLSTPHITPLSTPRITPSSTPVGSPAPGNMIPYTSSIPKQHMASFMKNIRSQQIPYNRGAHERTQSKQNIPDKPSDVFEFNERDEETRLESSREHPAAGYKAPYKLKIFRVHSKSRSCK